MERVERKPTQRELSMEVLRLLQREKAGLHFLAIFKVLHARRLVGSYSSLSRVLKNLMAKKLLKTERFKGRGIPKKIYSIRRPNETLFELGREMLMSELSNAKIHFSTQAHGDKDILEPPPFREGPKGFVSMEFDSQLQPWVQGIVSFSNEPHYVQHVFFDEGFKRRTQDEVGKDLLEKHLPTFANSLFWRFVEILAGLETKNDTGPSQEAPLNDKIEWIRKALDFSIILVVKLDGKKILDEMRWEELKKFLNNPASTRVSAGDATITNLV